MDSITDGEQGSYDLALTVAKPGDSAYPFESGGTKHVINGSHVILAVASKAMETLFMTSPALHRAKNARRIYEDIVSVLGMKLMKVNLYYEHAWRENGSTGQEPVKAGPAFTDLPINASTRSLRSSDLVLDQFGLPPITTVSKPCPTKKPPVDPKCVDGRYVYPNS